MPWPEKNGKGYRATWEEGGRRRHGPTLPTREDAERWGKANVAGASMRLLSEALDLWRKHHRTDHGAKAVADVLRVTHLRAWTRIDHVTPAAIEGWRAAVDDRGVSRPLQYLLGILRWCHRVHGVNVRADVLAFRPPKPPRRAKAPLLSEAQVGLIRDAALIDGPRAYAVIDYLLTYGARPVTACRLLFSDLDLSRLTLRISNAKHSGGWVHPVREEDATRWAALHRDGKPADPLFFYPRDSDAGPRGWSMKDNRAGEITWWYRSVAARAKLPANLSTIYHLKRYAISTMLARGLDPATVALFTGHVSLDQVMTYSRTNETRAQEALAKLGVTPTPPTPPKRPPTHLKKKL